MNKRLYLLVDQSPRRIFYVREYQGSYSHGVFKTKDENGNDIWFDEDELEFFGETPEETIRKFRAMLKKSTKAAKSALKTAESNERKMKSWTQKGFKVQVITE